ncbi:MAG: PDZ domain-containing protein [Planctomycetota bacterium]
MLTRAFLVVATLCTAASAQTEAQLVAQLDHPSFELREQATAALAAEPTPGLLERLETLMNADDATPEQRLRLRDAAQRVFDQRERGGLGVRFPQVDRDGPVRIEVTVEGFPAFGLLQPEDRVAEIDGRVVRDSAHMRWLILSKDPGEVLKMVVLRAGRAGQAERINVDVPLGRYNDLRNPRSPAPSDLYAAYEIRLERRGVVYNPAFRERTIGNGLTPMDWLATEGVWPELIDGDALLSGANTDRVVGADSTTVAAVGGQPRAIDGIDAMRAASIRYRERQINRQIGQLDRAPWEQTVGIVRQTSRQIIEIDRLVKRGLNRTGRAGSPDGLLRERATLVETLSNSIPTIRALSRMTEAELKGDAGTP